MPLSRLMSYVATYLFFLFISFKPFDNIFLSQASMGKWLFLKRLNYQMWVESIAISGWCCNWGAHASCQHSFKSCISTLNSFLYPNANTVKICTIQIVVLAILELLFSVVRFTEVTKAKEGNREVLKLSRKMWELTLMPQVLTWPEVSTTVNLFPFSSIFVSRRIGPVHLALTHMMTSRLMTNEKPDNVCLDKGSRKKRIYNQPSFYPILVNYLK